MTALFAPDLPAVHLKFAQVPAQVECCGGAAVSVEWSFKRNCSLAPAQLLVVYASLCVISLGIATCFWLGGATLVMPFAWAGLSAVGLALLVYARHADRELVPLQSGRWGVAHFDGRRIEMRRVPAELRRALAEEFRTVLRSLPRGRWSVGVASDIA